MKRDIILQTEISKYISVAKASCWICNVDTFEIIERGKIKEIHCDECMKREVQMGQARLNLVRELFQK